MADKKIETADIAKGETEPETEPVVEESTTDFNDAVMKRITDKLAASGTPVPDAVKIAEGIGQLGLNPAEVEKTYGRDVALKVNPLLTSIGSFGKSFSEAYKKGREQNALTKDETAVLENIKKSGLTGDQIAKGEDNLRKEVNKLDIVKQRDNYFGKYKQMKYALEEQAKLYKETGLGNAYYDHQLVYQLNKLFDENSVVRESEFANTAAARSLKAELSVLVQKTLDGTILDESQRQNIVAVIDGIMKEVDGIAQPVIEQYSNIAKKRGLDIDNVILFREKFIPLSESVPKGITKTEKPKEETKTKKETKEEKRERLKKQIYKKTGGLNNE